MNYDPAWNKVEPQKKQGTPTTLKHFPDNHYMRGQSLYKRHSWEDNISKGTVQREDNLSIRDTPERTLQETLFREDNLRTLLRGQSLYKGHFWDLREDNLPKRPKYPQLTVQVYRIQWILDYVVCLHTTRDQLAGDPTVLGDRAGLGFKFQLFQLGIDLSLQHSILFL